MCPHVSTCVHAHFDQCRKKLKKIQRSELNIIFGSPGYRKAPKAICRDKTSETKNLKTDELQWIVPKHNIVQKANAILLKVFQRLCQKLSVPHAKVCGNIQNLSRHCTHSSSDRVPKATCVACVAEKLTRVWCRRLRRSEEETRAYFRMLTETLSSLVEPFRLIGFIGKGRILYNTMQSISRGIGCSDIAARRALKDELHAYRALHAAPQPPTETRAIAPPSCTCLWYLIDEEDEGCNFM